LSRSPSQYSEPAPGRRRNIAGEAAIAWKNRMFSWTTPGEVMVVPLDQEEEAKRWVAA